VRDASAGEQFHKLPYPVSALSFTVTLLYNGCSPL
jgi:hypothetical protein